MVPKAPLSRPVHAWVQPMVEQAFGAPAWIWTTLEMPWRSALSSQRRLASVRTLQQRKMLISATAFVTPVESDGLAMMVLRLLSTCVWKTFPRSDAAQLEASVLEPWAVRAFERVESWHGSSVAKLSAVWAADWREDGSSVERAPLWTLFKKSLTLFTSMFHWLIE